MAANTCPRCGIDRPSDAPGGLCPCCLVQAGMDLCLDGNPGPGRAREPGPSASASRPAARVERSVAPLEGRSFGDYELIDEIARGGMGVVYKARQRSLDRVVALKMVLGGPLASASVHQRFLAEAQTAASLQHPNIVAIHEVGEHAGQLFFSMDYVQGRNLAELLRDGPLPAQQAATCAKTIAQAVHYAHSRGILHRDLKPSNVLIDQSGQPRITDFGLAKRLAGESDLTVSGQVLGSPNFMAPEQAQGRPKELGPPSDVYSIGALLYHLLTGRPPFQAATLTEVLRQVVTTEPAAPRLLNPSLPRDLETICLKCLEKDIARRYPTGQALADDLGRFLSGEPILARPLGRAAKAAKWCRRNPRLAGALGAALMSLLIGLAGVALEWRRAESQRARAQANEYVLSISVAQQALKANNPGRALELLNRYRAGGKSEIRPAATARQRGENPKSEMDQRGFEWRYLWQQCQSEAQAVIGKLATRICSLDVSGDGQWLFAGSHGGEPKLWNLSTGEQVSVAGDANWAYGAFSPDSRLLLACAESEQSWGRICIRDLRAGKWLEPILDPRPVGALAFSADGRWFGFGAQDSSWGRRIVVLNFQTRERVRELALLTRNYDFDHGFDWVFTRDGRSVIFSENNPDCRIGLCDLAAGSQPQYYPGHREAITAMALSPDGQILATGAGYTETAIKLWQVPSFQPLGDLPGHEGWVTALRFSPDGRTLASAAADQTMRLWDVRGRKLKRPLAGLPSDVLRLCFAPGGGELFSGSADGTVHRWSVAPRPLQAQPSVWSPAVGLDAVVKATDGKTFAGLRDGRVCLGEIESDTPPSLNRELGTNNTCLLFSSDGQSLFAGTRSGEVQVWSLDRRQLLRCLTGFAEPVRILRQDPQGHVLVVAQSADHFEAGQYYVPTHIGVWGTGDWGRQKSCSVPIGGGNHVSTDGRWLAVGGEVVRAIHVWSLSAPAQTHRLSFPAGGVTDLAFSPDGRLLAVANFAGTVKVWELPQFRECKEFQAHSRSLSALAFSRDSRRLAVAGEADEAIKLWDVGTWQEMIVLPHARETLRELLFTADDEHLIANNPRGDFFLWRAPSFAEIAEPASHKTAAR